MCSIKIFIDIRNLAKEIQIENNVYYSEKHFEDFPIAFFRHFTNINKGSNILITWRH